MVLRRSPPGGYRLRGWRQVDTHDERQGTNAEEDARLLRAVGLARDQVLADLGCGTGALACEVARACAFVHLMDVSRPMLRAAERRARALGLQNVAFRHAGFLSFDLRAGAVDLITTKYALHHLPDFWKAVALSRMHRALASRIVRTRRT